MRLAEADVPDSVFAFCVGIVALLLVLVEHYHAVIPPYQTKAYRASLA
jgi:hypothetical protein